VQGSAARAALLVAALGSMAGGMSAVGESSQRAGNSMQAFADAAASAKHQTPGQLLQQVSFAEAIRRVYGGMGRFGPPRWPNGEGWTNRRYQRAARKARNVLRNKRAHRG
jgi:hypothetical protein